MRIIIAGDFSLQGRVKQCQDIDVLKYLIGVVNVCKSADFNIVNFESPIAVDSEPIAKDGPNLKNSSIALKLLSDVGFNVFTLANNHLKDYGAEGVKHTIELCKKACIQTVGAGKNLDEAIKPLILSKDGQTVAILDACENESSIAARSEAGAAPIDIIRLYHQIQELKTRVDKVICIFHGGVEHYQLPTPDMKKKYRFFAEAGADLIVNHHQHCYSGYEIYRDVPIFYGLGNFYFDNAAKRNSLWNYGYMLSLDVEEKISFEIIPYEQCNKNPKIVVLDKDAFNNQIEELNSIIADYAMLEKAFDDYIDKHKKPLSPFLPYGSHYLKALYHRGLFPSFVNKKRKVIMQNAVRCESHREVLLRYFEKEID